MNLKFAEFDLGHEIGITVDNEYVIRFRLPSDFPPTHKEALIHFLGLVASRVNRLPQIEKDGLLQKYFRIDKIPNVYDSHSKLIAFQLLKMDEEIEEKCRCPQRAGQVCLSNKTRKHEHEPYKAKRRPKI